MRKTARLWGIQTDYTNADKKPVQTNPQSLLKVLEALTGTIISSEGDLKELSNVPRRKQIQRQIEPVHVIWDQKPNQIPVWVRESDIASAKKFSIHLENGEIRSETLRSFIPIKKLRVEEKSYVRIQLALPKLPFGYHRLILSSGASCLLICAPKKAKVPEAGDRRWGVFAPLYALRSERDWGIGDLTEMAKVQSYLKEQGGSFFGTLPILASELDSEDCDPSPYSPVSRLFWNEIFLDVDKLAQASQNSRIQSLLQEQNFTEQIKKLRSEKNVDYYSVQKIKKQILEILSEDFFTQKKEASPEFQKFIKNSPQAENYARFRGGSNLKSQQYHLYVQFQMDQELSKLQQKAKFKESAGLYLDFPVGVSRGGFDSKEFSSSFLLNMTAGAPPDPIFPGGQSWGFAPLHPIHLREQGYEYFIQCIRHHMKYASVLRLDHIMAFHRIYAIPEGAGAGDGAYLRYRPEEFYALLNLESQRFGVRVVGEDLGTVPDEVREALKNHDCLRMWVLPFEVGTTPAKGTAQAPAAALACLNTHDMIPFGGHFEALDVKCFLDLKVIDPKRAEEMKKERAETLQSWMKDLQANDEESLLQALLEQMAKGPSELVLVTLEDLWGEREPQNIPGTWKEYPNWRRKLKLEIQEWSGSQKVSGLLQKINELRKQEFSPTKEAMNENTNRIDSKTTQADSNHSHSRRPTPLQ